MNGVLAQSIANTGVLSKAVICETLEKGLAGIPAGQKILVLIPDHTRSLPLPYLFRSLVEILQSARQLDFMVALGTHPQLSEKSLDDLVGVTADERRSIYKANQLLMHEWDKPSALTTLGYIEQDEIRAMAGAYWHPSLPSQIPIRINKAALEYDHILIVGPTFPHEVVGYSGGAKYLFPGISGPEMINATHWLGALAGIVDTIGIKTTPVRAMIDAAAKLLSTPRTLIALTVVGHDLSGLFIGDTASAWSAAADLSAKLHIHWCERPFQQVISCAPSMYDELWTAAKAMYKLEPAIEIGGEVIVYAPHLDIVSRVHGKYIYEIGYHILQYFLRDWERFKHIPLGVLAHSTHLRGSGVMEDAIEKPNVKVTLASKICAEDCAALNLGYLDPSKMDVDAWKDREAEGILVVPHAGETLYRIKVNTGEQNGS
jgi:lactate racemase